MSHDSVSRRHFLEAAGAVVAAAGLTQRSIADNRPSVTQPRATSGDRKHQPHWQQKLTLTVGPKKADLVGSTEKVIQAAIDYVARLGGGTVKVLPGEYRMQNSVFLSSGVRILGSGNDSLLIKNSSTNAKIVDDSDWYDQEITLADGHGFNVGDGVCLRATNTHNGAAIVLKRTLVARSGNRFKLDKALRKNFWLSGKPTAASLFPLLSGEHIKNVVIENIALDGNRKNNAHLDGNYAGCIFLQDCSDIRINGVTARNYNGDGISWQICHDVTVENCNSHDNADLGLHPGSGSQRPLMRNNTIERNRIGIFFCWGVKFGLAEANTVNSNGDFGISIGHNDTDNLVRNNRITDSGKVGVLFRDDARGKNFWPNRNRLENNQILNSGGTDGIAIDVLGKTRDVTIHKNKLSETRKPMNRTGIRISSDARDIQLEKNTIDGFAIKVADQRK